MGSEAAKLRKETGCFLEVGPSPQGVDRENPETTQTITIRGPSLSAIEAAEAVVRRKEAEKVQSVMTGEKMSFKKYSDKSEREGDFVVKLSHEARGQIIGRGGETMKGIQRQFP